MRILQPIVVPRLISEDLIDIIFFMSILRNHAPISFENFGERAHDLEEVQELIVNISNSQ